MNKELLNDNINEILEGLKTAIHTANAELPAILDEIVRWGVIQYSVLSIIFLVCTLLCVGLTIFFIKNDEEPAFIAILSILSLIPIFFFIWSFLYLCFVYTAPKLYIIDYLKDLIQ
jgi:hypothetical protein